MERKLLEIIRSFGEFVVEGNFVVGIIVFIILVIINFMVITKGAGRVAEVAARFTLDAMPGKQMAVDADLNAGLINDTEAKEEDVKLLKKQTFTVLWMVLVNSFVVMLLLVLLLQQLILLVVLLLVLLKMEWMSLKQLKFLLF